MSTYMARPVAPDGRDPYPPSPERRYGRTLDAVKLQLTPGVPYMVCREGGGWFDVIDTDGSVYEADTLPGGSRIYPVHYSPREITP